MGTLIPITFLLVIPLTIFLVFVAPIWLWIHYRKKTASDSPLAQNEQQQLMRLTEDARLMRERIQTLEQILDAEHPNWRER